MKCCYAVALIAVLFAASSAEAQVVDMSTITCADFSARPTDQMAIMFWLEGYYTEEDEATTVDFAEFKSTLEKLLIYCGSNPTIGLLTAADKVMDNDDE